VQVRVEGEQDGSLLGSLLGPVPGTPA
jgi:hypothetical protein